MPTLTRKVTDSTGRSVTATKQFTVQQPSAPSTRWGCNFASGSLSPLITGARPEVGRIYYQPGDFTSTGSGPTWTNDNKIQEAVAAGVNAFIFSMKDASRDDGDVSLNWRMFLASIPASVRPNCWLTYNHEHEGKIRQGSFTAPWWDTRFNDMRIITQGEGFKFGPIHNGLNRNTADTAWVFGNYVEPSSLAQCDFDGLDCYDPNNKGAASLFFSATGWYPYFHSVGKPIIVAETGVPWSSTQDEWAAAAKGPDAFNKSDIAAVAWWRQMFTGNPDYRMTDATQQVWFPIGAT